MPAVPQAAPPAMRWIEQQGFALASAATGDAHPMDFFNDQAAAERALRLMRTHQVHRGEHRIVRAKLIMQYEHAP